MCVCVVCFLWLFFYSFFLSCFLESMFALHNNLSVVNERLNELGSNNTNEAPTNSSMVLIETVECFPITNLDALRKVELDLQDHEFFKKCVSSCNFLYYTIKSEPGLALIKICEFSFFYSFTSVFTFSSTLFYPKLNFLAFSTLILLS